jgi:murein DD-endopeptidase MepM/ murein hydrolase activator NlpD
MPPQQTEGILTQNILPLLRSTRFRRLAAAVVLPFLGVVAAFAIAPNTVTQTIPVTDVVQQITLPAPAVIANTDPGYWHDAAIRSGDTIGDVLTRLGVDDSDASDFLRSAKDAKALYRLIPGKVVRARTTADGKLLALRYRNSSNVFAVNRNGDGFAVSDHPARLERRVIVKAGTIVSSLFGATDAIHVPEAVALKLADIFGTDIDFHKDLRRGDRFAVAYEAFYNDGEFVKSGRVLAAEFVNDGHTYQAIYFDNDGHGGYYAADGKNMRNAFLRSPLPFTRITSRYSDARYHPILKKWRRHTGVDLGAPMGTPVKATANGTVEFDGRRGGYGNLIILKHMKHYETYYGHLSRFAKGLHRGEKVQQGEVIGYVGMTGLATGPHLHYEFRINHVPHNPMKVALPTANPITAQEKPAFHKVAATMEQRFDLVKRATQVASIGTND